MFLCVALSGCADLMPYGGEEIVGGVPATFTVYVCGAVENEGYYDVQAGTDLISLIQLAGVLEQSVLPTNYTDTINGKVEEVLVNYFDGEKTCYCIDANSPLIARRFPVDGLPAEVVDLLADWLDAHGVIRNKRQLKQALGSYANDYHYRFYIAKENYEKTV